jgi:hypothetical protein
VVAGVRERVRAWLLGALSVAVLGVWAAPAKAVTFSQQTLPERREDGSLGSRYVAVEPALTSCTSD